MEQEILILLFFVIAAVYASAGFGGGTGYLAAMALFSIPMDTMRTASLLCNILVTAGGTWVFYRHGFLSLRKVWPLVAVSIPAAFLGGMAPVSEHFFKIFLGFSLIIAGLLLFLQPKPSDAPTEERPLSLTLLISATIGGISGMMGIGGGIFLAPVLHIWHWDMAKKIAATASFFILVNSIAGIAGQHMTPKSLDMHFLIPMLIAVFLGGQIGSRMALWRFQPKHVRWVTGVIVLYAGSNILWKSWM